MDTFLLYIVKSGVCLSILYICLKAFLSSETFFRFNRWVLLLGTAVCLLIPFLQVDIEENSIFQKPFRLLVGVISGDNAAALTTSESAYDGYVYQPVLAEASSQKMQTEVKSYLSVAEVLLFIYILGGVVNLILLLRSVSGMLYLIRKGRKQAHDGYTLVLVQDDINPFSWGKYIVLSENDYKSNPHEILTHEIAHIKHRHSYDLFYLEAITLLQWFNPAAWLLKKEMKDIHEYQADMSVLKSGIDATKYQLLLVKKAVGSSSYTLANSFNHSKIKKRITMMLKEKSNKWAQLKLLFLLPAIAFAVYAFAHPEAKASISSFPADESTNYLSDYKIVSGNGVSEVQDGKPKWINDYVGSDSMYYMLDGKRLSYSEYDNLMSNSDFVKIPEYIPFAKGKIVRLQFVFDDGQTVHNLEFIREMYVKGKASDRSDLYILIDGVKYDYEKGVRRLPYIEKEATCQIISKDGTKSPVFQYVNPYEKVPQGYIVLRPFTMEDDSIGDDTTKKTVEITPPVIKKDDRANKGTAKRTVKFTPPRVVQDTLPRELVPPVILQDTL